MPTDRRYAARTEVPVAKSRADIEEAFERFGVQDYVSGFRLAGARFEAMWQHAERNYVLRVELPVDDPQETRRRMRSLYAVVKGLLVGVQDGVFSFEQAFLSQTYMSEGRTVFDVVNAQLEAGYSGGELLLPPPSQSKGGR